MYINKKYLHEISVSMGQTSHGLPEPCAPGSTMLQSGVRWTIFLSEAQVLFQVHVVVGQIHFFAVVGLRSSFFFFFCCQLGPISALEAVRDSLSHGCLTGSLIITQQLCPPRLPSLSFQGLSSSFKDLHLLTQMISLLIN